MPLKELREKYGASKTRQAINRAIRAECPGGDAALELLELLFKIAGRHGWCEGDGRTPSVSALAYRGVLAIVDAMEDEIRRRWQMPIRPPREDDARGGAGPA